MNIEEAREYCLSLKNVTESFPFDDTSLVFKVENKMFSLLALDAHPPYIAVKCNTDHVEDLRDRYSAVDPAYHFHKKYWNAIFLESDMPDKEIKYWIRHSYCEVIAKLPKVTRELYKDETNEHRG